MTLEIAPREALARLAEVAEEWGAEWRPRGFDGGEIELPVVLGLRRGVLAGTIGVEPWAGGCRVSWAQTASHLRLQRAAVGVLAIAALPAVTTLAWPFFPVLLPLVPVAGVLAFAAWWLVVSRLHHAGPREFLEQLVPPES